LDLQYPVAAHSFRELALAAPKRSKKLSGKWANEPELAARPTENNEILRVWPFEFDSEYPPCPIYSNWL
jgi:hypothetical protein